MNEQSSKNEKITNKMRKTTRPNPERETNQSLIFQPAKREYPSISELKCEKFQLTATLSDGRVISIPTAWFSRLRKATEEQLNNFELAFDGYDIH